MYAGGYVKLSFLLLHKCQIQNKIFSKCPDQSGFGSWGQLGVGSRGQKNSCLCGRPSSLTAPLLECKTQIPKVPRLRVLHVWGFGEAPGLPELARLLWGSCPANPTHSTQRTKPSSHPLPCLPSYSHRSSWPARLQPPRLLWPRPLITQDVYY